MDSKTAAEIATVASAFIILLGFGVAVWQIVRLNATSQAQIYLGILQRADKIALSKCMDTIRSLRYRDYEEYQQMASPEEKRQVRSAIDFFNDIQHLIKHRMLDRDKVTQIYALSILGCADRLWFPNTWNSPEPKSWWLEGFRSAQRGPESHGDYFYLAFERLCRYVKKVQDDPDKWSKQWPDLPS
jgi:hypothetical protein